MQSHRGTGSIYQPCYTDRRTGERKRSAVWWMRFSSGGRQIRQSTKTRDRDEALAKLAEAVAQANAGTLPPRGGHRVKLGDLAAALFDDYRANGYRSEKRIREAMAHVEGFFGPKCRAQDITSAALTRYVRVRLDEGAARATVNRETGALARAFRIAVEHGLLTSAPRFPRLREDNARKVFITDEQFTSLLAWLPEYLRPLARVAYITGWRKNELLTRQWRHVDFDAGWLYLEPGETKNRDGRQFKLIPQLRAILGEQRERLTALERPRGIVCPWVFHRDGEQILEFKTAWRTATRKAGLPGLRVHDFRRTACRNLIRAGVAQSVAMKMMGWKSAAMLARYAIVDESLMEDAGAKLEAFLGGRAAGGRSSG